MIPAPPFKLRLLLSIGFLAAGLALARVGDCLAVIAEAITPEMAERRP